jgi:uncharacterized protein HemX
MTSSKLILPSVAALVLGGGFFAHDSSQKTQHQAELTALTKRLKAENQALVQSQKDEASRLAVRIAELESRLAEIDREGDEESPVGINPEDESGLPAGSLGSRSPNDNQESRTERLAYVASQRSTKFHNPECRSANTIKAANMVFYSTRNEAVSAGKEPCAICRP